MLPRVPAQNTKGKGAVRANKPAKVTGRQAEKKRQDANAREGENKDDEKGEDSDQAYW